MSFNGSGTFVINSAGQPVVANTVISATTFNALTSDLANGLTTCITKDGQTTPTANIPMGGFKITNLATGTAATDAATVAQIQSNGAALVTVTGTDTLTGSLTPSLVAYVTGAVYYFVAPATNTGAVTLNIDTLGAKNVTRDGTTVLVSGDIVSGEMVAVVYDGTRFQLISPVNSFTNLNVSGTLTVAGATTLNGNLAVGDAAADTINFKSSGWTLTNNVSVIGTWADIGTITTADINGGTIDGTTIGGGTAAAGTFTTVTATTGNITTVNATTVDSTNLEVTNLKAKDGTAAGSIADATGVVTLNSVVATTADINGGTIDATTIGGSSPAVGNFTTVSAASAVFTTATITTVNTTTLDLTNLEVTNIKAKDGTASMTIDDVTGKVNVTTVSAASMNAGVAAVTSLTTTGAYVASANVGTAVITNGTVTALTATGASIASMNAGVALLTTATVTNFTASGASIASANIGNLQFTAASIASINAGVAVITNLTATGASIASANVGTAVITAATVTGASIASMNAGVALLTTVTVTNLTATGASIASANVGTAVVTGLTVTGASIASINAGTATISGNLTLNGGTANGVLYLNGSKVATSGSALTFDGTTLATTGKFGITGSGAVPTASALQIGTNAAGSRWLYNVPTGGEHNFTENGTVLSWQNISSLGWLIGGSEQMRLTSTGLGIGTSSPAAKLHVLDSGSTGTMRLGGATFYGSIQHDAVTTGANIYNSQDTGGHLWQNSGSTVLTLSNGGNLGLGVTPSAWGSGKAIELGQVTGNALWGLGINSLYLTSNARWNGSNYVYTNNGAANLYGAGTGNGTFTWFNAASGTAGNTISFTQAMTLDASGNLGLGATTTAGGRLVITQNNATQPAIYFPTDESTIQGPGADTQIRMGGNLTLQSSSQTTIAAKNASGIIVFQTGSTPTERARITAAGDLLVGVTSNGGTNAKFEVDYAGSYGAALVNTNDTSATKFYAFYNSAFGECGSIARVTTTNAVTYNTTSDYRLKTLISSITNSGDRIDALNPVEYEWKENGKRARGFFAHEFQQVYADSVTGEKDAVDKNGNPIYQAMQAATSEVIADLVAEIQSLRARVAQLETK
jgi:hypothetical protein